MDPKPERMEVVDDAVPASLKALPRWVGWSWRWRGEKWDKPPLRIDNNRPAKSNDQATWTTYDAALAAHLGGQFDGIGVTFGDLGDGRSLCGIDLDDCITPGEQGEIQPWAAWVVARMDTYSEVSPSGLGVKMFAFGKLPKGRRADSDGRGVEMYESGRYFTVTGRRLAEGNREVQERTPVLFALHAELLGPRPMGSAQEAKSNTEWALEYLASIPAARADNYADWVGVGMALHHTDVALLPAWIEWSKASAKFVEGECERKWAGFGVGASGGLTIATLGAWAKEGGWKPAARPGGAAGGGNGRLNGQANGQLNGRHIEPAEASPAAVEAPPVVNQGVANAGQGDRIARHPMGFLANYGVDVERVVKIGAKLGVFDLLLRGGKTVQLGTTADVLNPRACQTAISDSIGVSLPEIKRLDWHAIGSEIIRVAELEDVGSDPQDELRDWIYEFVVTAAMGVAATEKDIVLGINASGVVRTPAGVVYLGLMKFLAAASNLGVAKVARNDLIQRLYREGFTRTCPTYRDGEKMAKVKCWKSGPSYYDVPTKQEK